MFKVALDLQLRFVPPMNESAPGIVLTRTLELPFPPTEELIVAGKSIDDCPDPLGFTLKHFTWDVDRKIFLARTSMTYMDEPLAFIPDALRSWLDLGWAIGSYLDWYGTAEEDSDDEIAVDSMTETEFDRRERLHTLPRTRRPREFNKFFRAMIRQMAVSMNNPAVAYAMDSLGRIVPEDPKGEDESSLHRQWREAQAEYADMTDEAQTAWQERVERYPTLKELIS
jgi:hypothetical protein